MNIKRRLLWIVLLQTLMLVAMVAFKQWTLNTGKLIELETLPVDPRSLFSGDYVRLNYKIDHLALSEVGGDREFKKHDRIYVVLKKENPYWRAVSIHHAFPPLNPDQRVIKGEVEYPSVQEQWNETPKHPSEAKYLNLSFGIENYFVPEGEGHALERPQAGEKVSIRLAVDRFGNAGIKAVLVNGRERYVERLF